MHEQEAMLRIALSFYYIITYLNAMPSQQMHFWNKMPVFRYLIPLISGILLQWYLKFSPLLAIIITAISFIAIISYNWLMIKDRFRFAIINGVFINLILLALGAFLVWQKDVRNDKKWYGRILDDHSGIITILQEPLVSKPNSFKALATVKGIIKRDSIYPATGNIIIYFKKEVYKDQLTTGSKIIITKTPDPIENAGNPGGFNYKRYSLFKGTTHQVFLQSSDFKILQTKDIGFFKEYISTLRFSIIKILRKYIEGDKEKGLAEALLVGYKDDLDKNLVQAYTNTGVVHLIAISGLHVGLIYTILLFVTKKLKNRRMNLFRIIIILCGLWIFAFLAGAQPSVLRSSLMFSLLATAQATGKRSYSFNALAFSAFILLCINPFLVWDVGFQLSYAAVTSILIFFRPFYNSITVYNKALDYLWTITAVTLAAQIFTLPISMYHFHQFPTLFLPTNFIAVPLVCIILIGEVILTAIHFIEPLAKILGYILSQLIFLLNTHIQRMNTVSFAVWDGIYINVIQTILLLVFAATFSSWIFSKKRLLLYYSISSMFIFFTLRTISFFSSAQQQKLIVYNVPKHQAIDIIQGRKVKFIGDAALTENDFLRNFHLKPSRIKQRLPNSASPVNVKSFISNGKSILIADSSIRYKSNLNKKPIDLLVLSKNPTIYISNLNEAFDIKQIVTDASVPAWKKMLWKKDADSLNIPFYDVSEKGAFVMKL
jgi:competence protein ComEC